MASRVGLDTENIAYIPPHIGTNSDKAAIAQICGSDDVTYIFLLYKWGACYKSFLEFMSDARITKVAVGISHDVSTIKKRFPTSGPRGSPLVINGQVELRRRKKDSLESMTASVLGEYVDKSIDHRAWEAPELDNDQVRYSQP